ncbi:MAG: hypothetical protein AAB553_00910 [Patescibacteria group bacterium]
MGEIEKRPTELARFASAGRKLLDREAGSPPEATLGTLQEAREREKARKSFSGLFRLCLRGTQKWQQLSERDDFLAHYQSRWMSLVSGPRSMPEAIDTFGVEFLAGAVADSRIHDSEAKQQQSAVELFDYIFLLTATTCLTLPQKSESGAKKSKKKQQRKKTDTQRLYERSKHELHKVREINQSLIAKLEELHPLYVSNKTSPEKILPESVADQLRMQFETDEGKRRMYDRSDMAKVIDRFLAELPHVAFTATDVRAEFEAAARERERREALEIKKRKWKRILRQGTGEERRESDSSKPSRRRTERDREEIIENLGEIVDLWGEADGAVEESEFGSRTPGTKTDNKYYAATLPFTRPDGAIVTHINGEPVKDGIVDNPKEGAVYVWRSDVSGENGNRTVYDVFDGTTKLDARAMGAIKVVHRGDWQERVLDYLTAPAEVFKAELDKRRVEQLKRKQMNARESEV